MGIITKDLFGFFSTNGFLKSCINLQKGFFKYNSFSVFIDDLDDFSMQEQIQFSLRLLFNFNV